MPHELHLVREGITVAHRIGAMGSTIGRSPDNDLVVRDPLVSEFHARVWIDSGTLWIRDLGSRNGTFLDGVRLDDVAALEPGAQLKLGEATLKVHRASGTTAAATGPVVVEDQATGVCVVLQQRVSVGGDLGDDLVIPGLPPHAATILQYDVGEVWLGTADGERELAIGETFELSGRTFVLRPADELRGATQMPKERGVTTVIHARLDGPTGPEATVTDRANGRTHVVQADNRAVLLYLLARQHLTDEALSDSDRGWCTNDDIMVGVWGKSQSRENTLHVLLHRLRSELEQAGLDPWFIEKRRGFVRARLAEATVD